MTTWGILLLLVACTLCSTLVKRMVSDVFESRYSLHDSSTNSTNHLIIECRESQVLSIMIVPQNGKEEELPRYPIFRREENHSLNRKFYTFLDNCLVDVDVDKESSAVMIKRKGQRQSLFEIRKTIFEQGHNAVETVDDSMIFGFGERFQDHFEVKDGSWSIWNRDRPWEIDSGSASKSTQTYGYQPVYLAREKSSKQFHIAYFKTVYAMNVVKQNERLTYHVVNGNVHFLLFLGSSNPEELLEKYHKFIGASTIPPFWAMGYHQCRWGYKNVQEISAVIENHERHEVPLDTVWNDLDYMTSKQDFTVDEAQFPLTVMKNNILSTVHWIPLIDAGIAINQLEAYKKGNDMDVFIKQGGNNYIGAVWPGKTAFVDFLHPNASQYWESMFNDLYSKIKFEGVWLDMNEISNFEGNAETHETYRVQHNERLTMMTIDINSTHWNSEDFTKPLLHSEVHAYYGHLMCEATNNFFKSKNLRPFIITRSNAVGTGAYASHWTGDNVANWKFLRLSISGNFLYQIFGIHMVGADICGFHLSTTPELCSRWMQLGAFYPFARNHNEEKYVSQEVYALGDTHLQTSKLSLNLRYSLLKQYYSVFVKSKGMGSIYRPLNFEFPADEETYKPEYMEEQFLIGNILMGVPMVNQGQTSKSAYFPEGWFGFSDGKVRRGVSVVENTLPAAPSLFLREGKVVFVNTAKTRTKHLDSNFSIKVALSKNQAEGYIMSIRDYEDNSKLEKCISSGCLYRIKVVLSEAGSVDISWEYQGQDGLNEEIHIGAVEVFHEEKAPLVKSVAITMKGSGSVNVKI